MVTIRERSGGGDGSWQATLDFDGEGDYPLTISDPFEERDEGLLRWYFERHLEFPFTDHDRVREARDRIRRYGEALFEQVFGDRDAYARYRSLAEQGFSGVRLGVSGTPEFQGLHWEALKDPKLSEPLALRAPVVRKTGKPQTLAAVSRSSPTINLLLVTARPQGSRDVGYRVISQPLVQQLRQSDLHVQVDVVRPGTYEALVSHLERTTADHGRGHYHVIHLDLHGALLKQGQLQNLALDGFTYAVPLSEIEAYEGQRAFLFFEGEQEGKSVPVLDTQLAVLLTTHGIPVAILNACQSGMQVAESEASLVSRLVQGGVQLALGMSYSVTVSAAERMMPVLYRELFGGRDLATAIRLARQELYQDKRRRAYFQQEIELEDWLLPVVYQNREVSLELRQFTPEEESAYHERQAVAFLEPRPEYGFVGRDLDVLAVERRVLRHNLLLLRGMGGAGKTTLLRHLGAWWQGTHLVDQVFEHAYDQRAWTAQQILLEMASRLLPPLELARFQVLSVAAQRSYLSERLRARRHLLILDNLESVTGSPMSVPNSLEAREQEELQQLLRELVGGKTLVLLGSRGGEEWLARDTFGNNVYELGGLDPEAASALAERILERHGARRHREDPDLRRLLELLDGFPLALEVVLANLASQEPKEVLQALEKGVELDRPGTTDKTQSILRCIEYSHSNLSESAQRLLLCLAPFVGVVYQPALERYGKLLREQPGLGELEVERWGEVVEEAASWGLLSPDPERRDFLRLQPVFPYFLRNQLERSGQAELRKAVEAAYVDLYRELGHSIDGLLTSGEAKERQLGRSVAGQEHGNLLQALRLALAAKAPMLSILNPLLEYLDMVKARGEVLELGEAVLQQLDGYSPEALTGRLGLELAGILDSVGRAQLAQKHLPRAKASYQRALRLLDGHPEGSRTNVASLHHQLGRVAEQQGLWEEAEQHYRQALAIYVEFNERNRQAGTYRQLGSVAQAQGHWEEAARYFMEALTIFGEVKDRYGQASAHHGLGALAEMRHRFEEAEHQYRQALAIYLEFNDRRRQAVTVYKLGSVARMQRRWQQAERDYRQALAIEVEFNDRSGQAATLTGLGMVAYEQDRWAEAERCYRQALETYVEFNDSHNQASIHHQLGRVAQAQRRWAEAEQHYRQALAHAGEFNDRYEQAGTYHQLGLLAHEQHYWDVAEQHYRQALATYIEFDDRHYQARAYAALGSLHIDQEDLVGALEPLIEALIRYREITDSGRIARTQRLLARIWRDDPSIPHVVARALRISTSEAVALLREIPG